MTTDKFGLEHEEQSENDGLQELVPSPAGLKRSSTVYTSNPYTHRPRHSKRLSLNFPVLVPIQPAAPRSSIEETDQSPSAANGFHSIRASTYAGRSPRSTSPARASPNSSIDVTRGTDAPDFLTLLATQERKVLELKEELHKAETELMVLKKQWAVYEANKKRGENKNKSVKLGPVSPKIHRTVEEEEEERERRREARERRLKGLGISEPEAQNTPGISRKSGQRVFEGRHTRTLSLLQTSSINGLASVTASEARSSTDSLPRRATESSTPRSEDADKAVGITSDTTVIDQASMTPASATGFESLSFGKTYKELANAASRKSIPPGADVFVKQGRQMYEGVSQGFWSFVEDIRQATVGEEAIHGMQVPERQVRRVKSRKSKDEMICERHGKRGHRKHTASSDGTRRAGDVHKPEKDNFWKEFGLETPQTYKHGSVEGTVEPVRMRVAQNRDGIKEHESKSSTDSKNPPDLLVDLMDGNDEEEGWENWLESPASLRARYNAAPAVRDQDSSGENDDNILEEPGVTDEQNKDAAHEAVDISWAELTR